VGAGDIWETSVPSAQFYCEPETTLKNTYFKRKEGVEDMSLNKRT
jgi:hypothetical protein